jgi:hypothetical protein
VGSQYTKRPENICGSCRYTWFPRGKDRSLICPRCGSADVRFPIDGCLLALGFLIIAPFVLTASFVSALIYVVPILLHWIGIGAKHSAPAGGLALTWGGALAKRCWSAMATGWAWIASVKDDLAGEEDRPLNPLTLTLKLLVIVVGSIAAILLLLKIVHVRGH